MTARSCWTLGLAATLLALATGACVPSGGNMPPDAGVAPEALTPVALASGERLQVLATTSIVADVVAVVGGERIDVAALVPRGVDPHSFEPTPQDVRRVADAQVVFENGLGLEAFLGDLVRNAGTGAPVVSVSARIDPLPAGADAGHGGWDPHTWLDPQNVILWTGTIEASLAALDPHGAAVYARNAQAYRVELESLDAEVEALLAGIPRTQRKLVTDHEEFAYFARRYGFTIVGTVIPAPSAAAEPSAQELAALETAIRTAGVRAVFVSSVVSPALARQVAQDTGVRLVTLYAHSLTDASGPAPTYLEMMRLLARLIAEALSR